MRRNLGGLDRSLRLILGIMLLGLYGALEPPTRYFTLAGLVLVGTALTGQCPVYRLFGLSTCRPEGGRGA